MEIDENIEKKGIKKVKGRLDKILLGVVVGGAVGSILGVTLAPKSGKETRKIIGQKGKNTWKKVSDIMEERKKRGGAGEKKKKGFWHFLNRIFMKKKK